MGAELAPVVARRDGAHAGAAGRPDPGAHRGLDRRHVQTVEHDFQHAVHAVGKLARRDRAKRGTERVVRRGDHLGVALRADLGAAARHAAREREDYARVLAHSCHGCLRRGQRTVRVLGEDEKVASAHAFLHPKRLGHKEFAFHHRDAPVALGADDLARLESIAEHASKVIGTQRYWRIPVMEGEFLVAETFGMQKGVGGGNFLILAEDADSALAAAEAAVAAMSQHPGVILPFPGGVARSGTKVGSKRYAKMIATTNDAFSPTLRAD